MENEILQTISAEIGEKVTRGNSLSYLGIDNFSKRSKVANAINNKFNLTIFLFKIIREASKRSHKERIRNLW